MIRFTCYGVIAEKPRVGHLQRIFPCSLYKNHTLDRKMIGTFLMISTSSINMQSLRKIVLRAPALDVYRQDAAKRQTAGIKFTHRPKIRFFAPQGRLP